MNHTKTKGGHNMTTYTSIEKSYVHDVTDTTGEHDYISTTILVTAGGETVFFQDTYVNRDVVSEFEWQLALNELEKFKANKLVKKEGKMPLIQERYDFESYQLYVRAEEA
jgi:hypothetical protein